MTALLLGKAIYF